MWRPKYGRISCLWSQARSSWTPKSFKVSWTRPEASEIAQLILSLYKFTYSRHNSINGSFMMFLYFQKGKDWENQGHMRVLCCCQRWNHSLSIQAALLAFNSPGLNSERIWSSECRAVFNSTSFSQYLIMSSTFRYIAFAVFGWKERRPSGYISVMYSCFAHCRNSRLPFWHRCTITVKHLSTPRSLR